MVKGYEHEDYRIDKLAGHGAYVVTNPEVFSPTYLFEKHEDGNVNILAYCEACQGCKAHAHAHSKDLAVRLL